MSGKREQFTLYAPEVQDIILRTDDGCVWRKSAGAKQVADKGGMEDEFGERLPLGLKAGLILGHLRQSGLKPKEWLEARNDSLNKWDQFIDRFNNRLTFDNLRFVERYVKGELQLLLHFRASVRGGW